MPQRRYFRRTAVFDFEHEIADGGLPDPLCLVCHLLDENLQLFEIIRRWRGEFGNSPPFPIDDDTLAVGYSLWADLTCFRVLGWQFPRYIFDRIPPIWRPATSFFHTNRTPGASNRARVYRTLALPMASTVGRRSTNRKSPRRSARAAGMITARPPCFDIAKQMSALRLNCCAANSPAIVILRLLTHSASCTGAIIPPRPLP